MLGMVWGLRRMDVHKVHIDNNSRHLGVRCSGSVRSWTTAPVYVYIYVYMYIRVYIYTHIYFHMPFHAR